MKSQAPSFWKMNSPSSSSSPEPTRFKRKRTAEDQVDADSDTLSSGLQNGESEPPVEEEDNLPVLSHAAKRRRKRVELNSLDRGDDSSVPRKKKRKLKDGIAGSNHAVKAIKRQNSVWVGNMSFKTTEENIRVFFKEKGAVEVMRINMPTKVVKGPGMRLENQGFAYVDFETPEAKKTAIALSEQPLLGRKLLIKDGDDFTGRPSTTEMTMTTSTGVKKSLSKSAQKVLKNQKQPPAPTLFFGNLSFDTTEDSIRELLEAHRDDKEKHRRRRSNKEEEEEENNNNNNNNKGSDLLHESAWIRKVRLSTFEDSGKCKGFAFVDFKTTEHATSALVNLRNHHLNGRDLVVEYASADAVRRGAPKGPNQKSSRDVIEPTIRARQKPKADNKATSSHKETEVDEKVESTQSNFLEQNVPQSKLNPPAARGRGGRKPKGRPKPGAALALAKRESAAIVPSLGQKITF